MSDDNKKASEEAEDKSGKKSSDTQEQKPKLYEEAVVKDLIAERDKAKEKLRKLSEASETESKKREEELLKSKNDYEGLVKLHTAEHEKAINSAKSRVINSYLKELGLKHQMNELSDISLFNGEIEIDDDYDISNEKDIEKAFEEFKKSKPYLFKATDGKPVPKTDNSPNKKIDITPSSKISLVDILRDRQKT